MKKLKKYLKAESIALLSGILLIAIGLIALVFPKTSLKTICLALGIFIILMGSSRLFKYIKDSKSETQRLTDLLSAIIAISVAIRIIIRPEGFLSVIPFLLGGSILIGGIISLTGKPSLKSKIFGIIEIIAGLCIIGAPFKFATAITAITGVALMILGAIIISKYKPVKEIRKALSPKDDGYREVEFTDVDD